MGAVPKKKTTRARSGRRSNAATKRLKLPNLIRCPNCKKLKRPHTTCPSCGTYK